MREGSGARGPRPDLRRRRQQRRAFAGDPRHARRGRGARRGAGRLPARRGARRGADRTTRRKPPPAPDVALHRRLGLDGRRRGRRAGKRRAALAPYRLDDALLDRAAPGAIALHCLPAHPGEEITEEVLVRGRASASGTRPRTAATRKRRCSSCSLGRVRLTMPPDRPEEHGRRHTCIALPKRERCQGSRPPRAAHALPRSARGRGAHPRPRAGGARRRRRPRAHDAQRRD